MFILSSEEAVDLKTCGVYRVVIVDEKAVDAYVEKQEQKQEAEFCWKDTENLKNSVKKPSTAIF